MSPTRKPARDLSELRYFITEFFGADSTVTYDDVSVSFTLNLQAKADETVASMNNNHYVKTFCRLLDIPTDKLLKTGIIVVAFDAFDDDKFKKLSLLCTEGMNALKGIDDLQTKEYKFSKQEAILTLRALWARVNEPAWATEGKGLIGSKTPDTIVKLKELLAEKMNGKPIESLATYLSLFDLCREIYKLMTGDKSMELLANELEVVNKKSNRSKKTNVFYLQLQLDLIKFFPNKEVNRFTLDRVRNLLAKEPYAKSYYSKIEEPDAINYDATATTSTVSSELSPTTTTTSSEVSATPLSIINYMDFGKDVNTVKTQAIAFINELEKEVDEPYWVSMGEGLFRNKVPDTIAELRDLFTELNQQKGVTSLAQSLTQYKFRFVEFCEKIHKIMQGKPIDQLEEQLRLLAQGENPGRHLETIVFYLKVQLDLLKFFPNEKYDYQRQNDLRTRCQKLIDEKKAEQTKVKSNRKDPFPERMTGLSNSDL